MSLLTLLEQPRLGGGTLSHIVRRYIPRKLMRSVKMFQSTYQNEEEMVQVMLSNSDDMLRMYGTARELAMDLKIFQNFPLSHRRFGFAAKEPFTTVAIMYKNTDGVPFMNKGDIFSLLQNIVNKDLFENKQLSSSDDCCFDKVLKVFKTLFPVWSEQESCEFTTLWKRLYGSDSGNFHDVSVAIQCFAHYLARMIPMYPEMFLPYDKETNPNCPIVVRVFHSHGVQFVMKSELFNAINIRNPNSKRLECKEVNGKLMTMSYEKVQRKYKDRIKNIEFIHYLVDRTDHKAVPIMTPSGDHCILATDFLFEILNELIFTHQIFQKIAPENRNILQKFFIGTKNTFSPHHKSIFFVTLEEQDKRKEEMTVFWKQFENIPAKYVRDVEKDGFTIQDLKDELEYLGLLELFPDIQEYAEMVHSKVFKAKKEEFLRTCDMFKAVEKCLLNCIFKRFPMLHLFLHTQNACCLLPSLRCDFCIAPNTNQFKNTNWNVPNYTKTISRYISSNPENTHLYEISLPDGTKLTNSYNRFFNMEQIRRHNIKYFIYDTQDLIYFDKNLRNLKPRRLRDECRYNLDAFQRVYPEKRIYIRAIPSTRGKREVSNRVFTEEVLDLIPVVLRQQNTPISENDDRLIKYRKKWETNDESFETTISLTEFWYILEEVDVDKTRITISPDPVYELTAPKMVSDMKRRTLNVIGPRGKQMMRFEQAVFHIFEVVVCSLNLKKNSCKKHVECSKEFKSRIVFYLRTYAGLDEGTYVTVEHVESVIKQLKNHCSFPLQSNTPSPLAELQKLEIDDVISKEQLLANCWDFGLSKFITKLIHLEPMLMACDVRTCCLSAWSDEFFDFGTLDLHYLILGEIEYRTSVAKKLDFNNLASFHADGKGSIFDILQTELIPESLAALIPEGLRCKKPYDNAKEKETPNKTVTVEQIGEPKVEKDSEVNKDEKVERCIQKTPILEESLAISPPTSEDIERTSVLEEALGAKKSTSDDAQKTAESDKASEQEILSPNSTQKTLIVQEALELIKLSPDDIQEASPIEKLPIVNNIVDINQSKCCSKCLRTSEMCNEAKKELKSTQNRLEKYEKKARRTDEVEKELKTLKLELAKKEKGAERREVEIEQKKKENEELRMKVIRLEANEIRMRLNEKNLDIKQNQMQVQIADLSSQLKEKNLKIDELKGQVTQLTRKEKSLNNKISKKENHVKKLQEKNRELSIRISHLEQSNSNLLEEITTISREGLGSPDDPKNRLLRLEKILESYSHGYQLKHSKEMVEKLKSCSDSVKIHQIADYERDQYDGKLMRYVHEVEMNIQKIKTIKDCSLITPLPEQPSFSNRFMDLYWKIINNQPITSTDLEVRDSECFICYEEMIYSQKIMICKECKKKTHWKCASKWLKTHRSCPHCRREMLDPEEFPDLS